MPRKASRDVFVCLRGTRGNLLCEDDCAGSSSAEPVADLVTVLAP